MRKPYSSITLTQAADLISAIGDTVTVLVQGEIGVGKSSILKTLQKQHPDYVTCYVDITTKDVGDFLIPQVRQLDGTSVCSFILTRSLGFILKSL